MDLPGNQPHFFYSFKTRLCAIVNIDETLKKPETVLLDGLPRIFPTIIISCNISCVQSYPQWRGSFPVPGFQFRMPKNRLTRNAADAIL